MLGFSNNKTDSRRCTVLSVAKPGKSFWVKAYLFLFEQLKPLKNYLKIILQAKIPIKTMRASIRENVKSQPIP